MATTYVVLQEDGTVGDSPAFSVVADSVEAANAAQARVLAAKELSEAELDRGVTLIAIPARNWKTGRGHLKAETQRRIRSA